MSSPLTNTIKQLNEITEYLKTVQKDNKFMQILRHYEQLQTNSTNPTNQSNTELDNNSDTNQIITNNELIDEQIDEQSNTSNTDTEIWSDIKMYGVTFNYQISNHGKVRNKMNNYILSQNLRDGYKSVTISYFDNEKCIQKWFKTHRLVGIMFVKNDDPNKTIVNHIDGNKLNNHWKNLEWTTIAENNQHSVNSGLTKITKRRVTQFDMEDNEIQKFESLDAAGKATGVDDGCIAKVCKGSRKSAGGFKWKYTDINTNEREMTEEELETFIQVKDFPNYLIDNFGRVYSKPYKKFLKTVKTRDNSQEIQLTDNGNRKTYLLHNLVADHFLDTIEGKESVGHIDGDKSNNKVSNLIRVTHSELCKLHINRKAQQQNQIAFLDV
jgi:hypothetical protein